MAETTGSQLFHGVEPVFLRRSLWTASGLPEFPSEGGDVFMPEGGDAMANGSRLSLQVSFFGVLEGLPGMFLSRQVILFSVFLSHTVGMRGFVV
jgi:hypothetical protein